MSTSSAFTRSRAARLRVVSVVTAVVVAISLVTTAGSNASAGSYRHRGHHGLKLVPGQKLNLAQTEQLFGPPAGTITAKRAGRTTGQPQVPPEIHNILDDVVANAIVVIIIYTGKKVFKMVKKWWITGGGKHEKLYHNAGDGQCVGAWANDDWSHLGSCNSRHGIYMYYSSRLRLADTYTGGVLSANGTNNGRHLFTQWPIKSGTWYTWSYKTVCAPAGCGTQFYGVVWVLKNSQADGLADDSPNPTKRLIPSSNAR